jgi:hypothetical protein
MKSKRFSAFLILVTLLAASSALTQDVNPFARMPKLWSVHIDEVVPSSAREFDRLSMKQTSVRDSILTAQQLPISPVYSIQTKKGKHFSFRQNNAYADLDQSMQFPERVHKAIDSLVSPYGDAMHALLRHHHNELWAWDSSKSSFGPDMKMTAGSLKFGFLRAEWVKPDREEVYDSVMSKFAEALKKSDAPVCRLTFTSRYGSGAVYQLFFAETPEQIHQIMQRQSLLTSAYGMQEGIALTQSWSGCLSGSEEAELSIDLSVTNVLPEAPWFGIKPK